MNTTAFLIASGLTAFLATCYGRLKADAPHGSHAWFGCTASPVVLAVAVRQALALHVWALLPLLGLSLLFQRLGRRSQGKTTPAPLRWRTAVYVGLAGAALLLTNSPVQAGEHDAHARHALDNLSAADPHAAHRAEALKGEHKRLEIDEAAPGIRLNNQHGKRIALKDLRGKVVAMTFFYTRCTDICPVLTNTLDSMARQLSPEERKQVALVGITVDPRRDTPARLKAYIKEHGLEAGQWQLLTGSVAKATQAAADYGIVVRPAPGGDFVHNSVYILIDRQGIERVEHHGIATTTEALLTDLRALIAAKK